MDLYEQAKQFPLALGGARRVVLRRHVTRISKSALSWRTQTGRVLRPFRGVYLAGPAALNQLERAKAALAVSPPGAALGFHSAALLHGFGILRSDDVHVVVPEQARFPQRTGIKIHRTSIPFEPEDVFGLPCTGPARTAVDLARTVPALDTLPVLDAALYSGVCTATDVATEIAAMGRFRGRARTLELAAVASPLPQCRQESQLRLILLNGGLTTFVPQLLVTDGYRSYYLDLGDPARFVGAEYDGRSHLSRERLRADRARHNALETMGWRMRYFTDADIYGDHRRIRTVILSAQQRS